MRVSTLSIAASVLLASLVTALPDPVVFQLPNPCVGPLGAIKKSFGHAKLVPPTVPTVHAKTYLSVQYNKSDGLDVSLGNYFNQSDVKSEPEVWFAADPTKTYTLVMIDPDVPSKLGPQVAHWVVSDLKPSCVQSVVSGGSILSDYKPPAPKGKAPFHRYALYLYIQPKKAKLKKLKDSQNFVLQDFVKHAGLQGPISGNFFLVDDHGQNE